MVSKLAIGLLAVQVLLGGYLFSYLLSAGQPRATARATRISDPVSALHLLAALAALALWMIYQAGHDIAFAWATLGVLALTAAGGMTMAVKTLAEPPILEGVVSEDPADARVAESQIPRPAIYLHGVIFLMAGACVLLVSLGLAD
ncbi:hypothetical protein JK386_10160 [Nocardioides sp. zg-536]|uniref:Uncharacterized protein n=1 Tax=Nocardioides faecalis TaxID=2803858 RepID=A0A938YA57_9ACTN|nr:hypothetical protein [Nocardioides faecalis]MBM9460266.1 hypothetical protein [Nocardioides faecalis]MBS4751191.1 hypothetical protein [Nocardioides faecalis]QVI59893.1 hypothetical protein KG111_06100 [Nocardioides faecalis]